MSEASEARGPAGGAGECPPASLLDPERRRVLLESVAAWLDELGEAEPPPRGVGPEASSAPRFSISPRVSAVRRPSRESSPRPGARRGSSWWPSCWRRVIASRAGSRRPAAGSARFGQRPVLAALVEGNGLALDRLDDALRRLDIHEIPSLGKPFDPRVMRAVEVAATSAAPPGTVLEVFRAGYT